MVDYQIINIKFSCYLSSGLEFTQIEKCFAFLSSFAGVGRIVFRHENFTFCIMGRQNNFLNVTGLKSFQDVIHSIKCFESFFPNPKILFQTLKFDSICAIYNASPKIIFAILSPKVIHFWVKRYSNILSRINIRPRHAIGGSKGMSANIFKSGKCVIFGASNLTDLTAFIHLINKSLHPDFWSSSQLSETCINVIFSYSVNYLQYVSI